MTTTLTKLLMGVLFFFLICLKVGTERRLDGTGEKGENPSRQGTAEKLPTGMERSDWTSIRAAHEEWKHTIRAISERESGWQAENPVTGLHASFDERGAEVRPEAGQWGWGLELVSYGVGTEQRSMAERKPKIGVRGRRIGYEWDGNLEEWYQNRAQGLEHGYTIEKRPGAQGEAAPLELRMSVRGGWQQVEVIDEGRGVTFGRQPGEALVRYHGLMVIDAEGREVAARLEAAVRGELRLIVEEQSASYPLTIDPTISQQAYLKASNTDNFDRFGTSVAISGNTVVVGAEGEDSSATGVPPSQVWQDDDTLESAGAAYVFVRSGGSWIQEAYLKASNTGGGDRFGFSVAISGETVVVGAKGEASSAKGVDPPGGGADDTAPSAGAAYVFVRSSGSWTPQAYLKASNAEQGDFFGNSVSISGETIVVGAPGEDSSAKGVNQDQLNNDVEESGAAYVFVRSGGSWSQKAYLKASNTDWFDEFGQSVAISGETIVVGAYGQDSGAGAAYVFVRSGGLWTPQDYLKARNTDAKDSFGGSVAISGETIVVGASGEDSRAKGVNPTSPVGESDNLGFNTGAAYVFVRASSGLWSQEAYLKASNTDSSDEFGGSVAISGDTVVVGATGESSRAKGVNPTSPVGETDNLGFNAGAAYVFVRTNGSWGQQAYLKASNTDSSDEFGGFVAISGETVVVGATRESSSAMGVNPTSPAVGQDDNNASGSGAAYLFLLPSIAINAGDGQSATVGSSVVTAPSVIVRDGLSNPVSGVSVTFAVASGGGSIMGGSATTNASGIATVGSWTLGPAPGSNTLTATSTGLTGSPLTFTATGTVGAATQIAINGGNSQTATVGTAVATLPSVIVRDVQNNPVSGVSVTFSVATGGGSITGGTTTTNASGIATVGSWGLGTTPGSNTLTATSPGLTGSPLTFTATGTVGAATQIAINGGDSQTATVGTAVATAPSVLVRDALSNPVSGVSVTFSVASGGGSVTGGSATTNASGIATVGSWTLGMTPSHTLMATSSGLSGSPVTFTAAGILPLVGAAQVEGTAVPGGTVTVLKTLTNTQSTLLPITLSAPLPAGVSGVSCVSVTGTCVIGAGTVSTQGGGEIYRTDGIFAPAASQPVTWTGAIPGNSTVTIRYVVQISALASTGTQYPITSTINGFSGPSTTVTVSASPVGPGDPVGLVLGQTSAQKPGSVLIYNLYSSGFNPAANDSRISITNTSPSRSAYVHFFFIDGANCSVADMTITLTTNQTTSFLASDFDPGVTGYLIAVATDANGCPAIQNDLIGESLVKLESGHRATLPALGIAALGQGGATCNPNATTATLAFDGLSYNALPRALAVSGLSSIANGFSSLLVVNRIGGNLGTGAATLGSLFGLLYDDQEMSQSFTLAANVCQLRGVLGNNFPRTAPRYTTVIPAGRSGWMRFAAVEDEAITGALLVEAQNGLGGGHNLHHLTTTSTATLTIPVFPAR